MKKRTTIRIISFLAAATVALGAASVIFYRRAVTAERENHRGEYAFSELCAAADGLFRGARKITVRRGLRPSPPRSARRSIPARRRQARRSHRSPSRSWSWRIRRPFFARTGDYALWLLRESSGGDDVSEKRENLRALGDTAALLSGNLAQLRSDVARGLVSTRAAAMDDALPPLATAFSAWSRSFRKCRRSCTTGRFPPPLPSASRT